jgi:hypothetical protein
MEDTEINSYLNIFFSLAHVYCIYCISSQRIYNVKVNILDEEVP